MTETKEEIKYAEDRPSDCRYCYWWGGNKKGCEYEGSKSCYYIVEEKPKKPESICDGCPYGVVNPCIGYCLRKILEDKKNAVVKKRDSGSSDEKKSIRVPAKDREER